MIEYFDLDAAFVPASDGYTPAYYPMDERVSLFWFDNYDYQHKFTFASLDAVEAALLAVETEYAKIINTFKGTGDIGSERYEFNVEAVESYLASAARLAATSSPDRTVADEIEELAPMYVGDNPVIGADNSINDYYEGRMNSIHDPEIDTLAEFLGAFQVVLQAGS